MKLLLFFAFTLAWFPSKTLTQHNPLKDPNICGRPICKGHKNFHYKVGVRHDYKYNVDIRTLFSGTSTNESALFIECDVSVEFLTPCDGLLNIKSLKLSDKLNKFDGESAEHEQNEIFSHSARQHSLRFSFNDGVISEICPTAEEKNWVLNFKRGLLSMLHNTMKRFDLDHIGIEDDVQGRCKTEYKVLGPNVTSLIIEKRKDLTSCEYRSKLHSMVQSTTYNFRPNENSGNLLKSSSKCNISIDHYIYNEIACEESHLFEPFSNQDAGATTIVKQRLILIDEIGEVMEKQPAIERRESLFYNQVSTPKPTSGEMKISRDLIKKLCKLSTDDDQTVFSEIFTKFIHTTRLLSYPALRALHQHARTLCESGKKHFIDSLPYLGSSAGVALMRDIILRQGVPEESAREWVFAISLIARPDETMLESLFSLLGQKYENAYVTLAISSLTHTFCVQNSNCETNEYASKIINYIEQRTLSAFRSERTSRQNEESFLIGLKAMANIGTASAAFKREIRSIIESDHVDVPSRVAAVEVHRRLPCEESRSYFEKLLRDQNVDPEIRIAAYLQVMRCPNYIVIGTIQNSLEVEEVNQVGSFIWSHLQNLLKSSIPSRVEIQSLLANKELVRKFSSDVRKFSTNYEGSTFFEEFNFGGNYESNVIFSPSSYIPRTAMLNMTVDLFGESINFLEVYGRFEGFEHYVESIFGPRGNYSAKNVKQKLSKLRFPRAASENDVLKSQVNELPDMLENKFGPPKVSLGMKVFGNDLKYATFNGEEEIKAALRTLNPIDHIERILSGKEINYSKATMFMDSSLVVPSGAGLPLTLNAVGTSSINMKIQGELNALEFIRTKELDLKGTFRPDVALDITGTMSVDAYYVSTGIKLKTSLYTSSAVDGSLKIRGKKLVNIEFSLPKKTTEIFGAKSELIVMQANKEVEQSGIVKDRVSESTCSWPSVEQTVGLKFCMDYHFPNVTKMSNAPYFVLAGSSGFRLSLQKSDPTTKTYLLKYKWEDTHNSSYISLTFDTPGSKVKRLLGANLTLDLNSHNLTLLMQSTAGTVVAKGKYKNTFAEKYLQLQLDVNNNKKFDTLLSLETAEIRNGHLYKPKIFLGVNNDRVAQLEGTLKWVEKAGVSQCDVDLKFQTKRLTSKLFGYISKTESSLGTDFKVDYAFVNTQPQWIKFYFIYANRSPASYFSFFSNSTLETTAYPQFNYKSSLIFKKSDAKTEGKFDFYCSPHLKKNLDQDPEQLSIELFVIYQRRSNSTNVKFNGVLKRPISNIDVQTKLSYERTKHDKRFKIAIHYAKEKDVVVTLYWYHPRHVLKKMEGFLKIEIPDYTPMVLDGKLKEKSENDYTVQMFATWFTGHNLTLQGIYQDRSTPSIKDQYMKVIIKSPSFDEINSTLHFFRTDEEFKIDLRADQNEYKYGVYLKHNESSKVEFTTEAKFKYKSKDYELRSSMSLKDRKRIKMELYFDQWRNIVIDMWAYETDVSKTAGFQLAWDANRDPNKIVLVTVNYQNPALYDYLAEFRIAYPDRTIHGQFLFLLKSGHISTNTLLDWGPAQSLGLRFVADYRSSPDILISLGSDIFTPIQGWKKTSFNGTFHHRGNMYRANGRVYWQHDQHISIDLFGDYATAGSALKCNFSGSLVSTVYDTLSLSTSFNHSHTATQADTDLFIMYHPKQIIDISSSWKVSKDEHAKNVTGTVTLVSPFKGFNKGLLVSKIYVSNSRELRGVADLDLDHRKFTASVEGHFHRLTNNMFVVNVTTPIEKFKKFNGRFGLSENNRHVVSMITHPTGRLGFEIIAAVERIDNFDTKFHLCTPIEFLQEILLVGLLKPDKVDLRAGWNSIVAGFSGVWHYVNISDFEYSYKLYTPIEGLEENGIVAKLIFKEGLDFEVSLKLSENRAGVVMLVKPKEKILKNMGIKTQSIYAGRLSSDVAKRRGPVNKKVDEKDPFSWMGLIEVDSILFPTINATIDIDQKANVFVLLGTLNLPNGSAEFKDEYEFNDALTMKNKLLITTTYPQFKQISSNFDIEIIFEEEYRVLLDLDYLNRTQHVKSGVFVYFLKNDEDEEEESTYNATLHVHTPLESFPLLDIHGFLSLEESIYSTNFTMVTNQSDIAFVGYLEREEEGLIDTKAAFHVLSPFANFPLVKFNFKQDFRGPEKRLNCNLDMEKYLSKTLKVETLWKYDSIKKFQGNVDIETPFKGFEKTVAGAQVDINKDASLVKANAVLYPLDITANVTVKQNILNASLIFDYHKKRNRILLNGMFLDNNPDRRKFSGELNLEKKAFDIVGSMDFNDNIARNIQLELRPRDNGEPISLQYHLQPQPTGYAIRSEMRQAQHHASLEGHLTAKHIYNWDLHIRMDTTHPAYKNFLLDAKAESTNKDKSININLKTPFAKFGNSKVGASLTNKGAERSGYAFFAVNESTGQINATWTWLIMENMNVKLIGNYETGNYTKEGSLTAFYVNRNKTFELMKVGGDIILNKAWNLGGNLMIAQPKSQKIETFGSLTLPPPTAITHSFTGNAETNEEFSKLIYLIRYNNSASDYGYGSEANLLTLRKQHINGDVGVEWKEKRVKNYLDFRRGNGSIELLYKLRTPKFKQEMFVTKLMYKRAKRHHVQCEVFHPSNRSVAEARVDFQEFSNMNGTVNVTTPYKGLNFTSVHFVTETSTTLNNRYIKISWPNDNAFLNSTRTTKIDAANSESITKGLLYAEGPVRTRHNASVNYLYSERPLNTVGRATVEYNNKEIVEGKYNCISELRNSGKGDQKDKIHVELKNEWVPVGADYVHEYDASGDASSGPSVDLKSLHAYHLTNRTKFNVSTEMAVFKTGTGQEIRLQAKHTNRTMKLVTKYDMIDRHFKHSSRLDLSKTVWISYDLDLHNKTQDESSEAREVQIDVSYPRRNFTAFGSYNMSNSSLSSEMSLVWDKEERTVQAEFDWKRDISHPNRHEVELLIKHPSFEKNVSISGSYETTSRKYVDLGLVIDYSKNPAQLATLHGVVEDNSNRNMLNYTFSLLANHPATNLNLEANGGIYYKPRWFYTSHFVNYTRSLVPPHPGEVSTRIDMDRKEIEFKRNDTHDLTYFWGKYDGNFPIYTSNITFIEKETSSKGEFYLNLNEKLMRFELNLTEDGSQSLHMYGLIPDARNAVFDVYRDYDDIHVSDISYFLKLNHSRLIVSTTRWRPELKENMQDLVRNFTVQLYSSSLERADFWRHYIRSQTQEAIQDIWDDAKPLMENCLDDIRHLKVLKEDVDDFKIYLNNSYNNNDFYIHDIVNVFVYISDELSLKTHIESLPVIVNEIWEKMGESGKRITKSILWAIEKIKKYYQEAMALLNGLVQEDSLEHISEALNQLVEKYDNFIKDMHIAFISYMEQLWKDAYAMFLDNWHKALAAIEPTFIKYVHYLETIAWNTSKQFLDFVYMHKHEIIESPYFTKITNFTQDVDKFYRDITGNDTITNMYKYGKVVYNFVKEKYFKLIPFADELSKIYNEIINELNELKKLPTVSYLLEKCNEIERKLKWFYDYFELETKLQKLIALIHIKLTEIKQNALQAENRYRDAKTKFIFEPSDGIIHLEQKLPMSWHAFNETPKFEEIPEYKAIYDMQKYFTFSKGKFNSFYRDFKSFMEPTEWLPPFKAQAMLAGAQYYITFDRVFYDFEGSCSYLLASDFLDRNFSIAISYNDNDAASPHELLVLINNTVINVNLFKNSVMIGNNPNTRLPAQVGEAFLYQQADILTIHSELGYELRCNMKFDICILELSGWYFGKTAGLWGTMNNEPTDDLLTSTELKLKRNQLEQFASSWKLNKQCNKRSRQRTLLEVTDERRALCHSFFSEVNFGTCFPRVPFESFFDMCLNSVSDDAACTSVVAYTNMCSYEDVILRIPEDCVKCNLVNGTAVSEGKFVTLEDEAIPKSADIVFIVEAKECNENIRNKRNMDLIVEALHKELSALKLNDNRYSLVVFGGNGVFDKPRSVLIDSSVFTGYHSIPAYFDNIPVGNGSSDIFAAIIYANKLVFRPGVSKTFVMIPCSKCKESNMKLDFGVLQQLLLENDVTLHILMNEEFQFQKTRMNKILFGIDYMKAYGKKDVERLVGDADLKKQVYLPKASLSFCTPLGLETNGTIFTAKKLEGSNKSMIKKFATVFAKRLAESAVPSKCKSCECTEDDDTGLPTMECYHCGYPTAVTDYGTNDYELSRMQFDDYSDSYEE